jgi:hypothetical protein
VIVKAVVGDYGLSASGRVERGKGKGEKEIVR